MTRHAPGTEGQGTTPPPPARRGADAEGTEAAPGGLDVPTHRFHLIVSTNRSPEHLERCLAAVEATRADSFVTVVEQHPTARCAELVAPLVAAGTAEYVHDPVGRGISAGRNRGMHRLRGAIVAFPDDDCEYTGEVLHGVERLLTGPGRHDAAAVRLVTGSGADTMLRWSRAAGPVTPSTIPHTVSSSGLFFRAETVRAVGRFDERLGTGSPTPFGSGEEFDFVLRALRAGASIRYEPALTVVHEDWRDGLPRQEVLAKALRYNRGFGKVLRAHRLVGEMLKWTGRSAAGVAVRTAQLRFGDAHFQLVQLRGRIEGWCWPWQRADGPATTDRAAG